MRRIYRQALPQTIELLVIRFLSGAKVAGAKVD
jgi:hypothetical protein